MNKEELFQRGVERMKAFCALNALPEPEVKRVLPGARTYYMATCAYYRPTTIHVMVEKCAAPGHAGRAWSWPGYVIDRTPYGVVQHELGHHVDNHFYVADADAVAKHKAGGPVPDGVFSKRIYDLSKEPPLTGYLGTDKAAVTFYMEWFAECFRLFVTNRQLLMILRPRCYEALLEAGLKPLDAETGWHETLFYHGAPQRILDQAEKKVKLAELEVEEALL